MVERGTVAQQIPDRTDGAGLVVEGTEDDPGDAGADEGAGAHRARFQGDDERGIVEAPATGDRRGLGDGHEFGMAERIGVDFAAVVTAPDDSAGPVEDDGPDGNVVMSGRPRRLGEGESHPFEQLRLVRVWGSRVQRAASSWSAKPTVSPTWATTRAGSERYASTCSMRVAADTPLIGVDVGVPSPFGVGVELEHLDLVFLVLILGGLIHVDAEVLFGLGLVGVGPGVEEVGEDLCERARLDGDEIGEEDLDLVVRAQAHEAEPFVFVFDDGHGLAVITCCSAHRVDEIVEVGGIADVDIEGTVAIAGIGQDSQ